jgi:hypothetical protein
VGRKSKGKVLVDRGRDQPSYRGATTTYNQVFEAQALTCLRLTGLKLAMVINFGERLVKNGIHRVVNGL